MGKDYDDDYEDEDGDGDAPPPSGGGKTVLIVVLVVVLVGGVCVVGLLAMLLMPYLTKAKGKANRTKCSNDLRQLGLASVQYGDDKRFLPHVGDLRELDGDVSSPDTSRKMRLLVFEGYVGSPEAFVCPSSMDVFVPIPPGQYAGKEWCWGGAQVSGRVNPLVDPGGNDPPLDQNGELSYGYTRKGLSAAVRSNTPLAADVGVATPSVMGNHEDGWNVLTADAAVTWRPFGAPPGPGRFGPPPGPLHGTSSGQDGFLSVHPQ